jgi:hypothetical protein
MNAFVVLDPVAGTTKGGRKPMTKVEQLQGKRVGFIWGIHELSTKFWPVFEEEVVSTYEPREVLKIYKNHQGGDRPKGNTWNPAPLSVAEETASKIDYAVLGVGA